MSRQSHKPKLIPVNQLRPVPGSKPERWESTGSDPEFRLEEILHGWVKLSFVASSAIPLDFTLYVYGEDGFPKEKINIGTVSNKKQTYSTIMFLDHKASALRLDPGKLPTRFVIKRVKLKKMTEIEVLGRTSWNFFYEKKNLSFRAFFGAISGALSALREGGRTRFHAHALERIEAVAGIEKHHYGLWIKQHTPTTEELQKMARQSVELAPKPVFSILMWARDAEENSIKRSIESAIAQTYPYWELFIVDDAATRSSMLRLLQSYEARDRRIKALNCAGNGHLPATLDRALSLAEGDFVCLMENNDEISPDALFEFAKLLNRHPGTDMIYSDEDRIDANGGRFEPFFKPDWSPEYAEAFMYTGRFACYRTEIARRAGGFKVDYESACEYDFLLRFTEQTQRIAHIITKILYHRSVNRSIAMVPSEDFGQRGDDQAARALNDRMVRLKKSGVVHPTAYPGCFDVRYDVINNPLVSIIIPSAGKTAQLVDREIDMLSNCINSVTDKSTYANYEIVVVDNNDLTERTTQAIKRRDCRFIHYEGDVNIATKMNLGARHAAGTYFLFLNDDIEVISPDWLEAMLQLCQRPGVAVVGAKLYYEDLTVQHAGVVLTEDGIPAHVLRSSSRSSPGYFFSSVANRNYLAVTGACLLTPKTIFEELSGFNQAFSLTCNDIDYCLKAHRAGYRIAFAAHAELFHYEAKTRGKSASEVEAAEYELFKKSWDFQGKDPYYSIHLETNPPDFKLKISKLQALRPASRKHVASNVPA